LEGLNTFRIFKYNKKTEKMEKHNIIATLKEALHESDRLWNEKEQSHAYIVGVLQGYIKFLITSLEE